MKFSQFKEVKQKDTFFIKDDYKHRTKGKYFSADDVSMAEITFQPDVYHLAGILGKKFGVSHIIDVGCGDAKKLVELYPRFEIIGIDHGENLSKCQSNYEFGTWLAWNFENSNNPSISPKILKNSVIVCADVIEHLVNPSYLLEKIREFLQHAPFVIITTPERDLVRGKDDFGPPKNQHHVREWNYDEFKKLLSYYGFNLTFYDLTASSNLAYERKTIMAVIVNIKLINKDYNIFNFILTSLESIENNRSNITEWELLGKPRNTIKTLKKTIEEQNNTIKTLTKTIEAIQNSFTWRTLTKLDQFRKKFTSSKK